MFEGDCGKGTRLEAEQPGSVAYLPFFVKLTGDNLLLNTVRVTWRCFPAVRKV